jgi:plasmid stability protein
MFRVEPERQQVLVRLPKEVKAWLESEALRNGRSQSSEVAQILRARMDTEPKKATG